MCYIIVFLIWLIKMIVSVFWLLDICNMPFMEIFDTTYPLNTLFWFLFWALSSFKVTYEKDTQKKKKKIKRRIMLCNYNILFGF